MKILCVAIVLVSSVVLGGGYVEANKQTEYKEEITRPAGTNWGFKGYRAEYRVNNPAVAEVIRKKNGEYWVHLIAPGDVVVEVTFYSGGKKLAPEYYLFHVAGNAVDDTAFDWGTFAVDVIRLTNKERAKNGLKPLKPAFDLSDQAWIRAKEASALFSHERPDGSPYHSVLKDISYRLAGENLQAGASTPEKAVEEWLNSPSHRENIMNADFEEIAVGYIYVPKSKYKHYWAQLFIKRN